MPSKKYVIGAILITVSVALSIIYVTWQSQGLRMKIDKEKSTFYIYQSGKWNTSGVEYNWLYNGTKRISKTGSTITVEEFINNASNTSTIIRTTSYPQGYKVIDRYFFDGDNKDTELFPVEHTVSVQNAQGLRYMYQVTSLKYSGPTISLTGTSQSFGKMKVVWSAGYLSAKLYSTGRLEVIYPVSSDWQAYDVRLFDPAVVCTFNGLGNMTKYEYGTTAIVNCTSAAAITIDQTVANFSVAANVAVNYKLDTLRYTFFSNSLTSIRGLTPSPYSIYLDNATDLVSMEFNVSSSASTPQELKLDYDKDGTSEYLFKGSLEGPWLINRNFTYQSQNYNAVNVTMSSIGYVIIYANIAAWNIIQNITFSLTGYNLDPVGVDFQENFTNTNYIQNYTQADTNMFNWMSFEKSTIGKGTTPTTEWDWTDTTSGGSDSCTSFSYGSTWVHNVTDQKTDDYLDQQGATTGGCTCDYAQYCSWSISTTGTHTTKIMDIKDYNQIRLKYTQYETFGGSARADMCSVYSKILITDGINSVQVYDTSVGIYNSGEQSVNIVLDLIKQGNIYSWNSSVMRGIIPSSAIYSLSTLNSANDWQIVIKTYYANSQYKESNHFGSEGCQTSGRINLFEVNASGVSLHEYVNGSYDPYFQLYGKSVFNPAVNITAVRMTVDSTVPAGTNVGLYVTADNHTTEEEVTSGILKFFTNKGNKLSYKINGTTTATNISPIVRSVRLEVIASAPANVTVDIGNDGDNEWSYNGTLNTTQTINADYSDLLSFINQYCLKNESCLAPISITSSSPGIAGITLFIVNQTMNPIPITVSHVENHYPIVLQFKEGVGYLNLSDLKLEYRGSKNVQIDAGGTNYVLRVRYSKFNVSLPSGVLWYDVYTGKFGGRNARNATPTGQTNATPIWKVQNLAYDDPINLSVWFESIPPKINMTISINNSKTSNKYYDFRFNTCMQENASATTSCGGYSNGTYLSQMTNPTYAMDNNYATCSWGFQSTPETTEFYVNYSLEANVSGVIWGLRYINFQSSSTLNENFTIPDICKSRGLLVLNMETYRLDPQKWLVLRCHNGTAWNNLYLLNATTGGVVPQLCEEAVYLKYYQPVINQVCTNMALSANCSIWNWWDIYNYTAKSFYMPTMKFSAICSNCTQTSDYLQSNVIVS